MGKWDFGATCTLNSWGLGPEVMRINTTWTFAFSVGPWFLYARRTR